MSEQCLCCFIIDEELRKLVESFCDSEIDTIRRPRSVSVVATLLTEWQLRTANSSNSDESPRPETIVSPYKINHLIDFFLRHPESCHEDISTGGHDGGFPRLMGAVGRDIERVADQRATERCSDMWDCKLRLSNVPLTAICSCDS
ncbi:c2.2 [Tranosema rostrale ichnovirus]|nr:c2.2 [Tranosema rostrale ichnovirus]